MLQGSLISAGGQELSCMSRPSSDTSGAAIFRTDSEEKQHHYSVVHSHCQALSLFWKFFQRNQALFNLRLEENRLIGCGHKERGKHKVNNESSRPIIQVPLPMVRGSPRIHWFGPNVGSLVISVHDSLWGNFRKDRNVKWGISGLKEFKKKIISEPHTPLKTKRQVSTLWKGAPSVGTILHLH